MHPAHYKTPVSFIHRVRGSLVVAAGLFVAACLAAPASAASLVINGDFETASLADPAWPDGWARPKVGAPSWEVEEGNHFVRLSATEPGQTLLLHRLVRLPAGAKALQLSVRLRASDLIPGAQPWFDARILADFKNDAGAKIKGAKSIVIRKSTDGWVDRTVSFLVPEGATILEVMPSLFQVQAGTFDVDNLSVEVLDASAVASPAVK